MAQHVSLVDFPALQSTSFEFEATFCHVKGNEKFTFNVRESSSEVTKIIFDLGGNLITVDRSKSSLGKLGTDTPDSGFFELLPGEDQ
jgi:beta-fructofuranosidase